MGAELSSDGERRWELYRLLGEPVRLRLLALAAEEELAIGELSELLDEAQPNVSRHVGPLRKAGLLAVRKQGTRALVRLADKAREDAVISDGLSTGRRLCTADGSLMRVPDLVARRDATAREFFARQESSASSGRFAPELPAYLTAVAALLPRRALAVDVGTGNGALLDVLAPLYQQVIAVDREQVQLDRARLRMTSLGYDHVNLICESYESAELRRRVQSQGGADTVFASRVLHHAPRPAAAMTALGRLLAPGGSLLLIDYEAHDDETLRDQQADLWLGFSAEELRSLASDAELQDVRMVTIPGPRRGDGPDAKLGWHCMVASRL